MKEEMDLEPEIFQVDKNAYHMIYGEYLVHYLPMEKRYDACLNALKAGRPYRYPKRLFDRMYQAFVTGQSEGPISQLCCTFKLDAKFSTRIIDADKMILRRGLLKRQDFARNECYMGTDLRSSLTFGDWLDKRLTARGFAKIERPMPKKYYWGQWLVWLVMILVFLGIAGNQLHTKFDTAGLLIVGGVTLAAFLAISLLITFCFTGMGFKEILYTKKI